MSIPTVDLSVGVDICVQQVKRACETSGFFFLKGHGIKRDEIDALFEGARTFFQLDQSIKDKYRAKPEQQPFGYQ